MDITSVRTRIRRNVMYYNSTVASFMDIRLVIRSIAMKQLYKRYALMSVMN